MDEEAAMTALAIACAALIAAACLHVAHRHRSLAERLVEIRERHVPMYAEVR
jgi:hypothetical protein